jgi:hypothetical protein
LYLARVSTAILSTVLGSTPFVSIRLADEKQRSSGSFRTKDFMGDAVEKRIAHCHAPLMQNDHGGQQKGRGSARLDLQECPDLNYRRWLDRSAPPL